MPDPMPPPESPVFVGDDLALDFINTAYGAGARHCECFVDDRSVLAWLQRAGHAPATLDHPPPGLLPLALALRDSARVLVQAAKAGNGMDADLALVNQVLSEGRAPSALAWDPATGAFTVVTPRRWDAPAGLLEPVAVALMRLLTGGDLTRVRQCEAHDCTLLFHDLTKSHRRRWCSMALCGNRMKVAAFRARQKSAGTPGSA